MPAKFFTCLNLLLLLFIVASARVQKRFRPTPDPADFNYDPTEKVTEMSLQFEEEWKLFTAGHGMPKEYCNKTICADPCPGAAPPTKCPAQMPYCHSECACTYYCEAGLVQCFMTSHCMDSQRKRFLIKRNRHLDI